MENSRLGRLPPELRSKIYGFVLMAPSPIGFVYGPKTRGYAAPDQWRIARRSVFIEATALTRVCKQLYSETKGLFFALNEVALSGSSLCGNHAWRQSGVILLPTFSCFLGRAAAAAVKQVTIDSGGFLTAFEICATADNRQLLKPAKEVKMQAAKLGWDVTIKFQPEFNAYKFPGLLDLTFAPKSINVSIPLNGSTTAFGQLLHCFDEEVKDGVFPPEGAYIRSLIVQCIMELNAVTD